MALETKDVPRLELEAIIGFNGEFLIRNTFLAGSHDYFGYC